MNVRTHTGSAALLDSFDLVEDGTDRFTARHQVIPSGRAYGGEILAQALIAATRTVDADRRIHSMHGYFLRAADVELSTTWTVDRMRDGRNFSARSVVGDQGGRTIFQAMFSFHVPADGVTHEDAMPPNLPDPETLPTSADALAGAPDVRDREYWSYERNFDIRHAEPAVYVRPDGERRRRQVVWLRAFDRLPDDVDLHRAAITYVCDYTLLEPVLRQHGVAWADAGVVTASLDHAMWFHHDARADEWFALVQDSPIAMRGVALTTASLYSQDGRLIATVGQEGLVDLPMPVALTVTP